MAIYHFHGQFISRGQAQSAVAAAAYRHTCRMHYDREARIIDYSRKMQSIHDEIALPRETPQWLRNLLDGRDPKGASEALWNEVENRFTHSKAQLAREFDIALPKELTREQNIELVRDFVSIFTARGMVVDWAYHDAEGNPHVHVMATIAPITEGGFGARKVPVLGDDGAPIRLRTKGGERIRYEDWSGTKADLLAWREAWSVYANRHLERHGHTQRIDHRSYAAAEVDLEPTSHLGPNVNAMAKRGIVTERAEDWAETRARNLATVQERPEVIFDVLTQSQSVFTMDDVAKALHRYVDLEGQPEIFMGLMAQLQTSPALVPLRAPIRGEDGREIEKAVLTTREMLQVETDLMNAAARMSGKSEFGINIGHIESALRRYDFLSDEQRQAVRHITGKAQLANVVGFAGAGKSTLLKAAREAWEEQGLQVYGLTLAGKAAEELESASGISSRTIASWQLALRNGRLKLEPGAVIVVDEAGMVGSRQLADIMRTVETAGAKLVLAGDPGQLQPIAAGGAFRAITERTGYAEVSAIRRQKEAWQKEASLDFARGRVAEGLDAYASHGHTHAYRRKALAINAMAENAAQGFSEGRETLCLAHTNEDVAAINAAVRGALKAQGALQDGQAFTTSRGEKEFAVGDRMIFLQNDRELAVKNGTRGSIRAIDEGGCMTVETSEGRTVTLSMARYDSIDHGYAATVHKAQGATIDDVHVLATRGMTRNMAYVAMTRHRQNLNIHYSTASFAPYSGGMAECLAQRDDKPLSVDYETTVAFGERRGFDTVKAFADGLRSMGRGAREWMQEAYLKFRQKLAKEAERRDQEESSQERPSAKVKPTSTPDPQAEQAPETYGQKYRKDAAKTRAKPSDKILTRGSYLATKRPGPQYQAKFKDPKEQRSTSPRIRPPTPPEPDASERRKNWHERTTKQERDSTAERPKRNPKKDRGPDRD